METETDSGWNFDLCSTCDSCNCHQIDTAVLYENHREIGEALAAGTVPREEAPSTKSGEVSSWGWVHIYDFPIFFVSFR